MTPRVLFGKCCHFGVDLESTVRIGISEVGLRAKVWVCDFRGQMSVPDTVLGKMVVCKKKRSHSLPKGAYSTVFVGCQASK